MTPMVSDRMLCTYAMMFAARLLPPWLMIRLRMELKVSDRWDGLAFSAWPSWLVTSEEAIAVATWSVVSSGFGSGMYKER